jgi:mono/diheme cytochrome c family protein
VKPIVLALALAACNAGTDSTDGAEIFKTICANCHGETGKPAEAMVQRLGVRDLTNAEFRKKLDAEGYMLVENQVRYGSKNQLMPSFTGALKDPQMTAVAKYVYDRFK